MDKLRLARLITKIENRDPEVKKIIADLYPKTGSAQVWGITGPPGAGKSTLVSVLLEELRKKGKRVAVLAVDPSSPFTGGAILGDRIRMQKHFSDDGVFIRSIGTRGKQGGLSHTTKEVAMALDAEGFDVVLIETAGVGQTELDILKVAQSVIVVLVPESGDSIQVMKAGLMEIADVFAVNKSDRPEADRIARELRQMVQFIPEAKWQPPVVKTEAVNQTGIEELLEGVASHQEYLTRSNFRETKEKAFLRDEVIDIMHEKLSLRLEKMLSEKKGVSTLERLYEKKTDPYTAASQLGLLD